MERARQFEVHLTERQREVWRLVAKGHTNGEIAERLGISLDGAKWHVGELLTRFGVDTREDLVAAWERERGAMGRLRTAFGGVAVPWPKLAFGTMAAATVGAGGLVFAALTGAGTAGPNASQPTADAVAPTFVALPAQPAGAVLDIQFAFQIARATASERMADHLTTFLARPGLTIDDLRLTDARLMPPTEAFVVPNSAYRYDAPASARDAVWVFSWVGEGLGRVEGPLGGRSDIHVDVLLADRTTPEVLAWRAHVSSLAGGPREFGASEGLNSGRPDFSQESVSHTYHAGWLNGDETSGELTMYRTRDWLCYLGKVPAGTGGGGCGYSAPVGPAGLRAGGFTFQESGQPRYESIVLTSDDVRAVAIVVDDAVRVPVPTSEIPRELSPTGRVVFLTSAPFDDPYWIIAYDEAGREIGRQHSSERYIPPPGN